MCKEISTITGIQKFPARLQSISNMHSRVGILAKKKKNDKAQIADWPCRPNLFWEKKREKKKSHKICIRVCCPRSHTVKILPYFKGETNKN